MHSYLRSLSLFITLLIILFIYGCESGNNYSPNIQKSSTNKSQSTSNLNNKSSASSSLILESAPQIGIFDESTNMVSFCYQKSFPVESTDCYASFKMPGHPYNLKLYNVGSNTYLYYVGTSPTEIKQCLINRTTKSFDPQSCVSALSNPSDLSNIDDPRKIVINGNNGYIVTFSSVKTCILDGNGKLGNCKEEFVHNYVGDLIFNGSTAYISAENAVYHCQVSNGSLTSCVSQSIPILGFNLAESDSYPVGLSIVSNRLIIANNILFVMNKIDWEIGQLINCPLLPNNAGGGFNNKVCTLMPQESQAYDTLDDIVTNIIGANGAIIYVNGRRGMMLGQSGIHYECVIQDDVNICLSSTYYSGEKFHYYHYISMLPLLNSGMTNIQAGANFACGNINNADNLACWGSGLYGQLNQFELESRNISQSASPVTIDNNNFDSPVNRYALGGRHICTGTNSQSLYCWGSNIYAQSGADESNYIISIPNKITIPNGEIQQIALGSDHTCLILSGRVYCMGLNDHGQLGVGSYENKSLPTPIMTTANFKSISLGSKHSCAIDTNGTAYCWGSNEDGQLGSGIVGENQKTPQVVNGGTIWSAISAGNNHTCAIRQSDGHALCWGGNENGQLGTGSVGQPNLNPAEVSGNKHFAKISAGFNFTCGLTEDNEVYCWGFGGLGQMGNGSINTINSAPNNKVVFPNPADPITDITTGNNFACASTQSDKTYCWGSNSQTQLGNSDNSNEYASTPANEIVKQQNNYGSDDILMTKAKLDIGYLNQDILESRFFGSNQNDLLSVSQNLTPYSVNPPNINDYEVCIPDPEFPDGEEWKTLPALWDEFHPDEPIPQTVEEILAELRINLFDAVGGNIDKYEDNNGNFFVNGDPNAIATIKKMKIRIRNANGTYKTFNFWGGKFNPDKGGPPNGGFAFASFGGMVSF